LPEVRDNRGMKFIYGGSADSGEAYEIEADRHGNYTIRLGAKVVKRVTSVTSYLGRPKWGSRKLEMGAIEEAKALIERGEVHERTGVVRTASTSPFIGRDGS
jgi:hypothetical protein